MGKLEFTEEETRQLRQIAEYYRVAKELIIYGEQIDPKHFTLSQTLNERVNVLDHVMRVILAQQGMTEHSSEDIPEYNKVNLDKAYGHVYRAAYDALDWVALTIREQMAKTIEPISLETISVVMPDYFPDIKPKLDRILLEEIAKLRNEKDVAKGNEANLQAYTLVVAELKSLFDRVNRRLPDLVKREGSNRRKQWIDKVWQVAIGILLLGVGTLIGWLLLPHP